MNLRITAMRPEDWHEVCNIYCQGIAIASIGLHKACGFCEVGMRQRLGKLEGRWRDVLLLERRSRETGI